MIIFYNIAVFTVHFCTHMFLLSKQWCHLCRLPSRRVFDGSERADREREVEKEIMRKIKSKTSGKIAVYVFFSPLIWFASYLFGGDNSFTQGLPTASQSRSLTGWGAVPKSLWWAVTEDAVSLGLPVAPDGHNAATRRLGNNALEDTAVVSGMKDARFSTEWTANNKRF